MIPTNSSSSTNGCDNISSNCVIWQGPDIACINLCNGDSISEVVSKLATEVCTLITDGVTANPNLTGLDLSCLNIQGATPTELVPVLQAMVVQICINMGGVKSTSDPLPIMTLPACMQYNDSSGNPVTELSLDLFATLIANQVCTNLSSINVINSTLTSLTARIVILENCVLPCSSATTEAQVIPTCILPSVLTNVSTLLLALEARFCSLETAVGLPAAILGTIQQSFITNSTAQLTNPGSNYGSIGGWNTSPINLAQSVQNAWVVIDDMYTAIASIQLNCCPGGCDSIVYGYTTTNVLDPNGAITGINFNFQTSTINSTFNDCAGSTVITITDEASVAVTSQVSVSTLQNQSTGITISIPTLNTNQALDVSIAFCTTDGVDTCSETKTSIIQGVVPCPAAITMSVITSTNATVNFVNTNGVTAVYLIEIYDGATLTATYTQNNPTANVSHTFTGLTPATAYTTKVTTTLGGTTIVCPTVPFTSESAVASCDSGMDVAFIIDYTGSMSDTVEEVKSGIASIISTIVTESGSNDYRLGLVLADEGTSNTPTYATSVEYVALPAAQKVINTGSSRYQFITAVEMFQTNNNTSFTAQLNKINTGTPTAGWPLGNGVGTPEPTDMAIGLVVEANALLGAFRSNVAKYLLIYTDVLPSGNDDNFDATDVARLNSLAITCATEGIKCFVLGAGVNATYVSGGTTTYPWRTLATATSGGYNTSYNTSTVISEIVNGCA
jgi:hypothetical protein